jgi:uncharacterized protein
MPEMTDYPPGTPSWVDLATSDPEGGIAFYGALFGWEFNNQGPDAGNYNLCTLRGKVVAGLGPTMNPGQPTAWSSYVSVEDADQTAKTIESAGGTVLAPPFDVMTAGRMGIFMDPTGAAFSVWQPRDTRGAELVNEPGAWGWNELDTRDVEAAKSFYQTVFGWESKTNDMGGGMSYTEFQLDGRSIAGMMPMPEMIPAEVPAFWLVYFGVDDTDAAAAKATELGGGLSFGPMDTPAGRFAVLRDPAGAGFAVITSSS